MNSRTRFALVALVAGIATTGCNWLTDFRQQPSIQPWQSTDQALWRDTTTPFRGAPQGSVPTTGTAVAAYEVSYGRGPLVIDSMRNIPNPIPATQASVDRGWKYYQINCAVCHGAAGLGDGPVARFVGAPNLTLPTYLQRTDGYIFGQLRNGGAIMPSFARIAEEDRWHIINYLRGLQGSLPADIVVQKEAPGLPGVTGDALPGASVLGPTVPSVFVKPVYVPTGGTAATGQGGHE